MAVVKHNSADINLMARLLRAEGEGEGQQGMLIIGNVGINRIRANCSDFKGIRTIPQMVYQPHAFEATTKGYFYQRARESERRLARRPLMERDYGQRKFSLWYFRPEGDCPQTWYDQPLVDGISCIVFINLKRKHVKTFITRFNRIIGKEILDSLIISRYYNRRYKNTRIQAEEVLATLSKKLRRNSTLS